ncbi:hypothetical protein EXIGLDRAFT_708505 [Exidia glandulosa HHB12029]|uniref:Uncharacterized protein n=1 Tax=Exidia glandulosa HHB12029 TaxID=1314781 RepID=A0A166N4H6_EXIGL|nr:hypothetical protein EXIGLDRAFT_708505 [Exidia glandulosa HHB12029]
MLRGAEALLELDDTVNVASAEPGAVDGAVALLGAALVPVPALDAMADGGIEIDIESPAAVGCELALVDGRDDTLVAGFDALAAEFDALADGGSIETKIVSVGRQLVSSRDPRGTTRHKEPAYGSYTTPAWPALRGGDEYRGFASRSGAPQDPSRHATHVEALKPQRVLGPLPNCGRVGKYRQTFKRKAGTSRYSTSPLTSLPFLMWLYKFAPERCWVFALAAATDVAASASTQRLLWLSREDAECNELARGDNGAAAYQAQLQEYGQYEVQQRQEYISIVPSA